MINSAKHTNKKKVMIVDDNQSIMDVMKLMLEHAGYASTITADPLEVKNLKEPLPDLLFLDILLSGADGGDLCRYLKDKDHTKHMPVIILSANSDIEEIALACGADGFLVKPFQMNDMLALIERHIA